MYTCPVCLYPEMPDPPKDYHICPCCGTEFGSDDEDCTVDKLRDRWIQAGAPWFFGVAPKEWSPQAQLLHGALLLEETKRLLMEDEQNNTTAMTAAAGASSGEAVGSSSQGYGYGVLELVVAAASESDEVGELQ